MVQFLCEEEWQRILVVSLNGLDERREESLIASKNARP